MRKIIYALLLSLSLGASADTAVAERIANEAPPLTVYEVAYVSKMKYEMWMEACFYSQYVCANVNVPNVKFEKMRKGLLGYYNGTDTIYIRYGLTGVRLKEVLMHEMIHYIQKQVGGLIVPGPAEQICHAENEAFGLVDQWLIDNRILWLVVGKNWWKPYTHCWKYYDPDWEAYSWLDKLIWSLEPDEDL